MSPCINTYRTTLVVCLLFGRFVLAVVQLPQSACACACVLFARGVTFIRTIYVYFVDAHNKLTITNPTVDINKICLYPASTPSALALALSLGFADDFVFARSQSTRELANTPFGGVTCLIN